MAPTIAYTLPAINLLLNVSIPITLTNVDIDNTNPSGIQSLSQIQPVIFPDGYIAHPDIRAAYKVSQTRETWKMARERCILEGTHLAVIDTYLKFEYLLNQTNQTAAWVGIHRMYDDTEWVSVSTGSTLTTLPWALNEPNGEKDCVAAAISPRGLRNIGCNTNIALYVCEIPIPENYRRCTRETCDDGNIVQLINPV